MALFRRTCAILAVLLLVACGSSTATSAPSTVAASSAVSAVASPAPAPAGAAAAGKTLTVFAAASLTEAFGELGTQFTADTGANVTFNFAGSQQLSQQLANGAPGDVFASANANEMTNAIAAGVVVSGTQQTFVRNRLVVIYPSGNPGQITQLQDLAKPGLKLDLAAEQVPVGQYTQQAFDNMSADPAFGADFKARVNANVVSLEQSVKSVVTKVSLDEADAGIVYRSDVTPAVDARIDMLDIPDQFNQLAAYPIAAIKVPPAGPELAQQFVDFVLSDQGQAVLERYNFIPVGQP